MRATRSVVGACGAIFWPGSFIFGFPGVIAPFWQARLGIGRGGTGAMMFFVLASLGIFMFLVGRWQKKVEPRRLMTAGAILCGLSVLYLPFVRDLLGIYLWAFLMGTSSCFLYIPGLTVLQGLYPGRKGLVSGIFNTAFGLSGAIMAPVFTAMLRNLGYPLTCLILGILAMGTGIPATGLIEKSDGGRHGQGGEDRSLGLREAIRTRDFWLIWATWAMQGGAGIAMIVLSVDFALSRGFPMEKAVLVLMAFNLANGLSRLISGALSDRLGRKDTMAVTFFLSGAAYLLLPHGEGLWAYLLFAAAVGFAFGTLFSVSAPLVSDRFGLEHFGAIFGFIFTAYGFLAGAIGPTLSGVILDRTGGDFTPVFTYLGAFCLASGVMIRLVRAPRSSPVGGERPLKSGDV